MKLLQFRFEPGKQRKTVGRRSGKAGEDLVVVQPANLARPLLDYRVAKSHLAIAGKSDFSLLAYADDRCRTRFEFHGCYFLGTVNRVSGKPELYVAASSRISIVFSPSVVRLSNNGVRIP